MNEKLFTIITIALKVIIAIFSIFLADTISVQFFSNSFIAYLLLIFVFVFIGTILLDLLLVKLNK